MKSRFAGTLFSFFRFLFRKKLFIFFIFIIIVIVPNLSFASDPLCSEEFDGYNTERNRCEKPVDCSGGSLENGLCKADPSLECVNGGNLTEVYEGYYRCQENATCPYGSAIPGNLSVCDVGAADPCPSYIYNGREICSGFDGLQCYCGAICSNGITSPVGGICIYSGPEIECPEGYEPNLYFQCLRDPCPGYPSLDSANAVCVGSPICYDRDDDGCYAGNSELYPQCTDCNDYDPEIGCKPDPCNDDGKDNNCNGVPDDEQQFEDNDNDGFSGVTCEGPPDDCDDNDPFTHPFAREMCNGKDNNCNDKKDDDSACDFDNKCSPDSHESGSFVSARTANLRHSQTLFTVPASILPIEFELVYNTLEPVYNVQGYTGPLGKGWTHPFNMFIKPRMSGGFALHKERGGTILYDDEDGVFKPENRDYPVLSYDPGNVEEPYTLTERDQTVRIFNTEGKLTAVRDRKGNEIILGYDASDRLATITHPTAGTITIAYYPIGDLIETITDPNNVVHTFTYNGDKLETISTPSPDGGAITWSYTYDTYMVSKTDSMDRTVTYGYSFHMPQSSQIEGEASGRSVFIDWEEGITEVTERDGGVWKYISDTTTGRLKEVIDPYLNSTQYNYTGNKLNSITYPEDPDNHPGWTHPGDYKVSYTYDDNGNVATVTEPGSTDPRTYVWTTDNQLDLYTDEEGNQWDYEYNAYGDLVSITEPSEYNPAGITTTFTYDYFPGSQNIQKKYVTNPLGQQITYEYDTDGNLTTITDTVRGSVIGMTYYPNGNLDTLTDPNNNTYTYRWDSLNRLKEIEYPKEPSDPNTYKTVYEYWDDGTVKTVTDANMNSYHYEYNYNGKITEFRDDLNNLTQYEYGGTGCQSCGGSGDNLVKITDANTKDWPLTNYLTGKRESQANPLGETTTYGYTRRGQLQSLRDPSGALTTFKYNKRGLLDTVIDRLTRATTYEYWPTGRLKSRTDRKTDLVQYTYTPDGKLDTIVYPDPGGYIVDFDYDLLGRLTIVNDSLGSTVITYDDPNRTVTVTDPNGFTVTYKNDPAGNIEEITYPGNKKVTYTYTPLNSIETVTDWLGHTATYHYDAGGRLESTDNINGTITDYGYDAANRLTLLEHKQTNPTTTFAKYNITELDGVGNRKGVDRIEPLIPTMSPQGITYSYNVQKNRLLSTDTSSYDYDLEGQLETKNADTFTFDKEHRLITAAISSQQSAFSYDGLGNRLKAVRNEVTTYYIYDLFGNLLAEATEQGNPASITKYYIHGNGLMAMIDNADNVYTYHYNAIGSTVAMTDINQNIVNSYAYEPFGELTESELVPQPFKYVGQYGVMHEPNGFYYMRARYYDPEVGRFISEDPIGFAGGTVNLYEYVKNNPVNWIDPLGLAPGDKFGTLDAAAIDAIDFILNVSISENVEYGGYIYELEEKCGYSYTEAVPGAERTININTFNNPPKNAHKKAFYHTHVGNDYLVPYFGTDDYLVSGLHHLNIYLGTPTGLIKMWNPGAAKQKTVREPH